MSSYPKLIERYRNATGFATGIRIKIFFKRTNIIKNYKRQILNHNIEKFSLIVKDNLDMFLSNKITI